MIPFSAKGNLDLNIIEMPETALSESSGWAKLETYEIGLLVVNPSGQWLAIPTPRRPNTDDEHDEQWGESWVQNRAGSTSFDINEFRGPINPEYAGCLLSAAGQAASHMPCLKRMEINVDVKGGYT
jgi:hypothetical protein